MARIEPTRAILLAAAVLVSVCSAQAIPLAESLNQIAEKASANEYKKLPSVSLKIEDFWSQRVTPFFPEVWPLSAGGKLVSYSYLYQFGGISDGERQKGPWCKITVDPRKPADNPRIVKLKYANVNTEVQGVHPASAQEIDIHKTQGRVYEILTSMIKGDKITDHDLSAVKEYYRSWQRNNGVIANKISREQKSFFNWVDSKK